MKDFFRSVIFFIANWLFNTLCLYLCVKLIPGMKIIPNDAVPVAIQYLEPALGLTVMNSLIRPLLLYLLTPLNTATVGLFSLVVNGFFILVLKYFYPSFVTGSLWDCLKAVFIFAILNSILLTLIPIDGDYLYFSNVIKRTTNTAPDAKKKHGLIMLEIDGLSYNRLMKAVESGKMPQVRRMLENGWTARPYDCGVPSQTSSCQAGILFGNNDDICAFRWYNRSEKHVYSSSNFDDAHKMESRILAGGAKGILTTGMSCGNIMSGGAEESLLTVSQILPKNDADKQSRQRDLYYVSLRPYLLAKSVVYTQLDALREVLGYLWDKIKGTTPRLNRLHGFYPLVRGATNILLRDISTTAFIDAAAMGRDAMYTTFVGYDEIAHHSGPDSGEAYRALSGIDRSIRKICDAIEDEDIRPYEVVILSDHGQSYGATFKQRYGLSLADYISRLAQEHSLIKKAISVIDLGGSDDNAVNVLAALKTISSEHSSALIDSLYQKLGENITDRISNETIAKIDRTAGNIIVLASGNLANAYFSCAEQQLTYREIEALYPGFCEDLIGHEGVGLLVIRGEDGPFALGKTGRRNLVTGEVSGIDPLIMYGDADKRAKQLLRLAEFPDVGDVIVISTVYEDGTVAAFEELIGSHGGIGGEQTEPFIMHNAAIPVDDEITNSCGVNAVLCRIRDAETPVKEPAEKESVSFMDLLRQIADVKHWLPTLFHSMLFSPAAFKEVVNDKRYDGPAALIGLLNVLFGWLMMNRYYSSPGLAFIGNLAVILIYMAIEYCACVAAGFALRGKWNPRGLLRAFLFTHYQFLLWGPVMLIVGQLSTIWIVVCVLNRAMTLTGSTRYAFEIDRKRGLILLPIILILLAILTASVVLIREFVIYVNTR